MQSGDGEPGSASSVAPEDVRGQLARILASHSFVSSRRLCRFLRFIVERTLEDDADRLKEFVVAMEVFDRDERYDPSVDSIVRVEARRLRSKLKAYYGDSSREDRVLISLRPGSYVPSFRRVRPGEGTPDKSQPPAIVADLPPGLTVAVLPFANMSPEPEQDFFCDGITEEIINALAGVESLSVVARTSAFQFKGKALDVREVGRCLGARVVVEGSVRKSGNNLRITAQAIDAENGYHLWSESYSRQIFDVFAIQEEISLAIAAVLRVRLRARSPTGGAKPQVGLGAYTGFLKAMFLKGLVLTSQQSVLGLHTALDQFRDLTRQYPDYAQPYASVAATLGFLSVFGLVAGSEVLPEMKRNAETAVRLDPSSAEAWSVLAGISAHWDYDWAKGNDGFERAILLQPGNPGPRAWYGMMLAVQGRFAEAEAELVKASRVNPLAAADQTRLAYLHYLRGDDQQAMLHLSKAFALEPDFSEGRLYQGLLSLRREDYARAVEILSVDLERLPLATHMGLLAAAYFRWGRPDEGQIWLNRLEAMAAERYVSPQASALAYVGAGNWDKALERLGNGITDRSMFAPFLSIDPFYEPLRQDSRFPKLLSRLNL